MKKLLLLLLLTGSGLLLVMNFPWNEKELSDKQESPDEKVIKTQKQILTVIEIPRSTSLPYTVTNRATSADKTVSSSLTTIRRPALALSRTRLLPPNDLQIPSVNQRPWYMSGGKLWPKDSVINSTTGVRSIRIFPDELPQEDRIPG